MIASATIWVLTAAVVAILIIIPVPAAWIAPPKSLAIVRPVIAAYVVAVLAMINAMAAVFKAAAQTLAATKDLKSAKYFQLTSRKTFAATP